MGSDINHNARSMNTTRQETLMQRWHVVQHKLLPELRHEIELTPKLERVELVLGALSGRASENRRIRIEPEHDRALLASPPPSLSATTVDKQGNRI
jgi:hypothetical protein